MSDNPQESNTKESFYNQNKEFNKKSIIHEWLFFFELMSKSDIKIFKFLFWAKTHKLEKESIFFSNGYIADKCNIHERTVQRFYKKFTNKLILTKFRHNQTKLVGMDNGLVSYIHKNGGIKIIENFKAHKKRLINDLWQKDININEQVMNKNPSNLSPHPPKICHPSLNKDINTYLEEEHVLNADAFFLSNEIKMKEIGLTESGIKLVYDIGGLKMINKSLDDALWFKKKNKQIFNPLGFMYSRLKYHSLKNFQNNKRDY